MNLLSKSCKKVDRGWLNRYGSDYMLTIDRDSNPNCNSDNTGYQLYMKFGNYWSCGGYSHIHTSSRWWFTVSYLGHGKKLFKYEKDFEFCLNAYLKLETIKSDLHGHSLMQLLPHNSVRESEVMLNTTCVYRWNDFLVSILHQLSGSQE